MHLMDVSVISMANENYKFMLVCVDVFSRLALVVPLKNKEPSTVIEAVEEVLDIAEPTVINCDNGSEFLSYTLKRFVKERGIDVRYVDVKDHHKLGIVDRFYRALRERINKHLYHINVLPKIIANYNCSYHSGIKKAPSDVTEDAQDVMVIMNNIYIA